MNLLTLGIGSASAVTGGFIFVKGTESHGISRQATLATGVVTTAVAGVVAAATRGDIRQGAIIAAALGVGILLGSLTPKYDSGGKVVPSPVNHALDPALQLQFDQRMAEAHMRADKPLHPMVRGMYDDWHESIDTLVADIVSDYDGDGTPGIDLASETARVERYTDNAWGDPVDIELNRQITLLANVADVQGDGDGNATTQELRGAITAIADVGDANIANSAGNGSLDGTENDVFQIALGEGGDVAPIF